MEYTTDVDLDGITAVAECPVCKGKGRVRLVHEDTKCTGCDGTGEVEIELLSQEVEVTIDVDLNELSP